MNDEKKHHTTGQAATGAQNKLINKYSEIVVPIDSSNIKVNLK